MSGNTEIPSGTPLRTRAYFSFFIFSGFVGSVFFSYICSKYLGKPYPYDTSLFVSGDAFRDMLTLLPISNLKNPYSFSPHSYGPLTVVGLIPFTHLNHVWVVGIFAVICLTAMGIFYFKFVKQTGILPLDLLFFLSFSVVLYPFLFCVDRGNFELIVFSFTALGVYGVLRHKKWLGILCLALAINCKVYTVLLLILYYKKKQYKNLAITAAISVGLTIASFLFLSLRNKVGIVEMLSLLMDNMLHFTSAVSTPGFVEGLLCYNHTFSAGFTLVNLWVHGFDFVNAWKIGGIISAFLFLFILAYTILVEKRNWRAVTILCLLMTFFHGISYDYSLLNLLIPLVVAIDQFDRLNVKRPWYLFLFPVFMVPWKYYVFFIHTGISVVIYPVCALLILTGIIIEGFRERKINLIEID